MQVTEFLWTLLHLDRLQVSAADEKILVQKLFKTKIVAKAHNLVWATPCTVTDALCEVSKLQGIQKLVISVRQISSS